MENSWVDWLRGIAEGLAEVGNEICASIREETEGMLAEREGADNQAEHSHEGEASPS